MSQLAKLDIDPLLQFIGNVVTKVHGLENKHKAQNIWGAGLLFRADCRRAQPRLSPYMPKLRF